MLITDVEIKQYKYCPATARHIANVCLTLKDQFVTMFCQLDLPENESADVRATAFVSDAMRQLRRMPEFRSGHNKLRVADHVAFGMKQIA